MVRKRGRRRVGIGLKRKNRRKSRTFRESGYKVKDVDGKKLYYRKSRKSWSTPNINKDRMFKAKSKRKKSAPTWTGDASGSRV